MFIKGLTYSLLGTFLLSTNYVVAKYAMKGFDVAAFSFLWAFLSFIFSLFLVLYKKNIKGLIIEKRSLVAILFLGIFTAVVMIFNWAGLALIDPLISSFIWKFAPVFTVILSVIFLSEKLDIVEVLCFIIMVVGGILSLNNGEIISGIGIVLTFIACLLSAIPMLIAKKYILRIKPEILIFYRSAISTILVAIWAFGFGNPIFSASKELWLVLTVGAFIGPMLSFYFIFKSYEYWDLSHSTIVSTLDSLFVLPMVYFAFGKVVGSKELLGGFIIMAGAFLFVWKHFSSGELKNGKEA